MLKAILYGKAGRAVLANGVEQGWREIFRQREDLLTATFFGRLMYLSDAGKQRVLKLLSPGYTEYPGAIESITFWPRLTGYTGRWFVEPDVLINCENVAFLIEVKPPFAGQQSFGQWQAEIESLVLQKEKEGSEWDIPDRICFVALGRNVKDWKESAITLESEYADDGLSIHAIEWEDINHGIAALLEAEEGHDASVYSDWIEAFALFGLIDRPAPFDDLLPLATKISSSWPRFFDVATPLVDYTIKEEIDWASIMKLANRSILDNYLWA
jgi:hypothetical protein